MAATSTSSLCPTEVAKKACRGKNQQWDDDDLLPQYDLNKLPIVAPGPGYQQRGRMVSVTPVMLDELAAAVLPDKKAATLPTLIPPASAKGRRVS
jgi:hypothetical protein